MKALDLANTTFGKLTALSFYGIRNKKRFWLCACECGNKTIVEVSNLRNGAVKSCGCTKKEVGQILMTEINSTRKLPLGESCFNILYRNYKSGAAKRGYTFNLSKEEFKALSKGSCYYCGKEPEQVFTMGGRYSPYIYNGVDRLDNNLGYEPSNVVSCCGICNKMKATLSEKEFLDHITRIYKHRA